jgi:hypothetical protein
MILSVSLALSLVICFLIVVSLFWRKALLSKKKKARDVEANKRNRHGNHTTEEHRNVEVEKEAKALQKIWARASARWKANARYSLRQRRGKRFFARMHHHLTASAMDDSRSRLVPNASSPPSVLSTPVRNHDQAPLVEEPLPNQNPNSCSSSPPAYHAGHQIPPIILFSPQDATSPASPSSAPSHLSRQPSRPSLCPSDSHPHLPDITTAHVATDDKTLLARLADFASAPPDETDTNTNISLSQVSAPEDLELEGLIDPPVSAQMDSLPSASLFPPPPSKERLAAAERLEYAFAYDNPENVEPEGEPSAPPFEEVSALPPLLFPSAPPIIDNEEGRSLAPLACLPSAPALEDVFSPHVMLYEERDPEQCDKTKHDDDH